MKRVIALLICFTTVFTSLTCFAEDLTGYEKKADSLKFLGLLKGSDIGYELERVPTRAETVVCLVRLLGKEKVANSRFSANPFKDVPTWAGHYIGYGYNTGLCVGIDGETFGTSNPVTSQMAAAFLLRSLGLSEKDGDFEYQNALSFAEKKGLIDESVNTSDFKRADLIAMCYNALNCTVKNSGDTLSDTLIKNKVFTKYDFNIAYKIANDIALEQDELQYMQTKTNN